VFNQRQATNNEKIMQLCQKMGKSDLNM